MFALYLIFVIFVKIILYASFLFMLGAVGFKLLFEPVNKVCLCTTKLNGKVALVTGGTSGIGLETARDLAKRGAKVVIAGRNVDKAKKAIIDIIRSTGNTNVEYRQLDLSKFSSIKRFSRQFNTAEDRLDILVHSANTAKSGSTTSDSLGLVQQVNYFGPFLLTNLLSYKLMASEPSRIIIVSSAFHRFASIDVEDITGIYSEGAFQDYARSKLCQVLWSKALSRRLPNGVTVNALHPGAVKSTIFNYLPAFYKGLVFGAIDLLFKTAKGGAQTSIHLSVAPTLQNCSGGYYSDCKLTQSSKLVEDEKLLNNIWKESLFLTKTSDPFLWM